MNHEWEAYNGEMRPVHFNTKRKWTIGFAGIYLQIHRWI